MSNHILAIDQGTTSSRAILFDDTPSVVASAQQEFPQHYPASGWVEHEPEDIWRTTLETVKAALTKSGIAPGAIGGIGLTNQRETVVVWDKSTGKAVHRAIVWQDRRAAALCDGMRRDGLEAGITEKTGLLLDPYFSATKIAWVLDNVEGARAKAENGDLLAGTIDTFLIWKLTGGRVHVTDATNASRTLLFDIRNGRWDDELLGLFNIPRSLLPEVKDSAAEFGMTDASLFGAAIPIRGVAGDQQAATLGQACFERGMMKATYGTGCFALLNTGADMVLSQNRLLTTIAYQLKGQRTYALEGSIFVAGAAIQWLRDGLKVISSAEASGALASEADPNQSVYLVPAFVGLGAPHWDADARGAIFGITRNTGAAELAKAALESVAYQTTDLLQAMAGDWGGFEEGSVFRVDGGMVRSDWAMQRLADLTGSPVDRPVIMETTALGAAWLAGWQSGTWPDQQEFAKKWRRDRRFEPDMPPATRQRLLAGWTDAVRRTSSRAPTQ